MNPLKRNFFMSISLKYLSAYSPTVQNQVQQMLDKNTLEKYLLNKYPSVHDVTNDKSLRAMLWTLKINI